MPKHMRADPLSNERRARLRCRNDVPLHDAFERVAAQLAAPDRREQRIAGAAATFLEPGLQHLYCLPPQGRAPLLAAFAVAANVGTRSGDQIASHQVDDL